MRKKKGADSFERRTTHTRSSLVLGLLLLLPLSKRNRLSAGHVDSLYRQVYGWVVKAKHNEAELSTSASWNRKYHNSGKYDFHSLSDCCHMKQCNVGVGKGAGAHYSSRVRHVSMSL